MPKNVLRLEENAHAALRVGFALGRQIRDGVVQIGRGFAAFWHAATQMCTVPDTVALLESFYGYHYGGRLIFQEQSQRVRLLLKRDV